MKRSVLSFLVITASSGVALAEPDPATTEAATSAPAATAPAPVAEPSIDDFLKDEAPAAADAWTGPAPVVRPDHVWIEHHGYLRVRVDGFYKGHLDTFTVKADQTTVSTSGMYPPLTENAANATSSNKSSVGPRGEDWIAGANMRFRYAPTLHVGDRLSIRAQLDILDNLILGSTPDYNPARPDAPLALFASTQSSPSAGINGIKDAVSVRQAYLNWDILNPNGTGALLSLSAGRMARHFGLGLVDNDGQDLDADFGTYVDRVSVLGRFWGTYFELGYNWMASGPTYAGQARASGEPRDLTSADNVGEVTLGVFSQARTAAEKKARDYRLRVLNKPVLDWGVQLKFRQQDLDISAASLSDWQSGAVDPTVTGGGYDTLQLTTRGGWSLTPDAWLRLEYVPAAHRKLRIELEAAGILGHVDRVLESDPASSMDIRSFGLALQSEYTWKQVSFGLDAGFASGDSAPYFGYLDKSNFADPKFRNPQLSSFYFHPDYRVDTILFRHVIGTVTDAMYFKPFVQYDLFENENDALAGRLDILYARAIEPGATPGDAYDLGVETNLKIFYEEKGFFYAGIEWAMLWPLKALDLIPTYEDAGVSKTSRWSTAVRARIGVMF
jgi:uncharacterized protein (TIGR04551 family)